MRELLRMENIKVRSADQLGAILTTGLLPFVPSSYPQSLVFYAYQIAQLSSKVLGSFSYNHVTISWQA